MNLPARAFLLTAACLLYCLSVQAEAQSRKPSHSGKQAGIKPAAGAVASAHPLATRAGIRILQRGGNAFDAAVAVSAVLAVVEPYSSGLGGGGFWLLYRSRDKHTVMIDGRETAPASAHRDMYLDKQGNIIPGRSITGVFSAGIPGEPAALVHIARRYGKLPLKVSLAPAIELARKGFRVDRIYRRLATFRLKALNQSPAAKKIFLRNGQVPAEGTLIVQKNLARTLELIANKGRAGFYEGKVARLLVDGVRNAGGNWTMKDLANYKIKVRKPVIGTWRNMRIISAAPPSSGGIALVQILNTIAHTGYRRADAAGRIHFVVEAMRRAYRDRAEFLGDPDFYQVPVKRLTSKKYAGKLASKIHANKATDSKSLPPVKSGVKKDSPHTTHFSILDKQGNRVAATLTINYPFGSCFVPPGTGVVLNDEMDDFSSKPGTPNVYGLIGADANAIAPGKRPLSSMTPSFIETPDRVMIVGTPGGSRIITMVLLAVLKFDEKANAAAIVARPRYHHQYLPDVIQYEPGAISPKISKQLQKKGHRLKPNKSTWGNMHVIIQNLKTGRVEAASDPRGIGKAEVY